MCSVLDGFVPSRMPLDAPPENELIVWRWPTRGLTSTMAAASTVEPLAAARCLRFCTHGRGGKTHRPLAESTAARIHRVLDLTLHSLDNQF